MMLRVAKQSFIYDDVEDSGIVCTFIAQGGELEGCG